jgi:hypothetical protein
LLRALFFSIKYRDSAFQVGFLICSQNYSAKCRRTDLSTFSITNPHALFGMQSMTSSIRSICSE